MTEKTLSVPDISCNHCKATIEGALKDLTGVQRAEVDVAQKLVNVEFDEVKTDAAAIVSAVEDVGFDVAG